MDTDKIKIFIVDDNKQFRDAVTFFLSTQKIYTIIGEASNGNIFLDKIDNLDVDIVLMDIKMPELNGIEATKIFNQLYSPDIKIITLSLHNEFEYMASMIKAGAKGYVVKSEIGKQLIPAINIVMQDKIYYPELTS